MKENLKRFLKLFVAILAWPFRLSSVTAIRILGTLAIFLSFIPVYNHLCWTHDKDCIFNWADASSWILLFIFFIAISERDEPSQRIRKRIPKSRWLRIPAWFFYPGSAGGICWYALNSSLLIFLYYRAYDKYMSMQLPQRWYSEFWDFDIFMRYLNVNEIESKVYDFKAIAAFGLTAVFLRQLLFKKVLPRQLTSILMVGVGFMVAMLFRISTQFVGNDVDIVANPWMTLDFSHVSFSLSSANETFVQIGNNVYRNWVIIVTLLLLPWFWRQIKNFKPLDDLQK